MSRATYLSAITVYPLLPQVLHMLVKGRGFPRQPYVQEVVGIRFCSMQYLLICVVQVSLWLMCDGSLLLPFLEKPTFTQRPTDVVAKFGSSVQFTCGVHGDPLPKVWWHKEHGKLPVARCVLCVRSVSPASTVLSKGLSDCVAQRVSKQLTSPD